MRWGPAGSAGLADAAVGGDLEGGLPHEFACRVGSVDGTHAAGRAGGDEFPAVPGGPIPRNRLRRAVGLPDDPTSYQRTTTHLGSLPTGRRVSD